MRSVDIVFDGIALLLRATLRCHSAESLSMRFGESVELVMFRLGNVVRNLSGQDEHPRDAARLRALPALPAIEARDVNEFS
jgi:hypothetical protein